MNYIFKKQVLVFLAAGLILHASGATSATTTEKSLETQSDSAAQETETEIATDNAENARKVLGSSVVTSVSVILDTGSEKHYVDAVGKPQAKPQSASQVASPINLLNPDRYEFYTFAESGDLVRRLMTLQEIQAIVANGDGGDYFSYKQPQPTPEKKVNDVVNQVQNVLKGEIEKNALQQDILLQQANGTQLLLDTPDVSSSWSVILPAIFGNNGQEINSIANANPKPLSQTPETIVLDQPSSIPTKKPISSSIIKTKKPAKDETTKTTTSKPLKLATSSTTVKYPIKLQLPSTTRRPLKPVVTKKPYTTRTTPTTAIPRITTRGTRPPPTKRTTTPAHKRTTVSFPYNYESLKNNEPQTFTPALFVIDQKTNTKIPITTREQLTTLLSQLPESTTELLKSNNIFTPKEPIAESSTVNIVKSTINKNNLGLLLSNSNIAEINSQLDKISTKRTPLKPTIRPSITQLITNAVGTISEATKANIIRPQTTPKIKETTTEIPTTEKQSEVTTEIPETTTVNDATFGSTITEEAQITSTQSVDELLNEAMGSLLSQVVSSDFTGLTTLQELPSTTEFKEENLELRFKTNSIESESTERLQNSYTSEYTTTEKNFEDDFKTTTNFAETATTEKENFGNERKTTETPLTTTSLKDFSTISTTNEPTTKSKTETTATLSEDFISTIFSQLGDDLPVVWTTSENPSSTPETAGTTVQSDIETTTNKQQTTTVFEDTTTAQNDLRFTNFDESDTYWTTTPLPDTTVFEKLSTINSNQKETTTLSIADLLKELTTKSEADEGKTTIVIITKPTADSNKKVTKKETEPNWSLVSTISPYNSKEAEKVESSAESKLPTSPKPVELKNQLNEGGLESTTKNLDKDVYEFVELCNELAFGFWKSVNGGGGLSAARSVFLSPFAATSLLAMVFLGARGATSGEMNEILKLDDMVTFNPHMIFKNVSESLESKEGENVFISIIVRELYSDRSKGSLLNFYKERAKQFYDGHVEEVSFKDIGDTIRRRTNMLVKKETDGKIQEYVKDSSIVVKSPLAGVSATIFQTDCSLASTEGRDGELHFVVLPSIRQRRLIPIPAAVWRTGFLAGYDPILDATAVALGHANQTISVIFIIPGQQGISAPGDGLARLEKRLLGNAFKENSWNRLLQSLIPRPGLEVQIPRFSHKSIINATVALQQMGMKDLFDAEKADLRGLNGVANDLYLSDILQVNHFATCGEAVIGEGHHSEIYPATANRTYYRNSFARRLLRTDPEKISEPSELLKEEPRDYQRAFHDPLHDPSFLALPLPLRPRQARLPDPPRLRFDRPFLYFVRHNPTGLILHMGRFNPRLLP